MMGIDVDRVIAATFFIARCSRGRRASCSRSCSARSSTSWAFSPASRDSPRRGRWHRQHPGGDVGGLLVGLVEAFAQGYLGGQWSDVTVFAILIGVLLVRPSGLLGARAIQKV